MAGPEFRRPLLPERPSRPGIGDVWPPAILPQEDVRQILREILARLESIEQRLERIEKLLERQ